MTESTKTIYQSLASLLREGKTVAMATIVRVKGSAPREVGAKMIVHPEGRHVGTVGGGCGEHEVILAGLDVARRGQAGMTHVDLTGDFNEDDSLGVCGGILDVFVEPWTQADLSRPELPALLKAHDEQQPAALITMVTAQGEWQENLGKRAVVGPEQRPETLGLGNHTAQLFERIKECLDQHRSGLIPLKSEAGKAELFVEVQHSNPTLLIVGAGHIALPLAKLGKLCDYQVVILDDRERFASTERFPMADQVLAVPFEEGLRAFPFHEDTCVVLVTRGHQYDAEALQAVIARPASYIGMIGSRKRVRTVLDWLQKEQQVPPDLLRKIHAPIGLDIGSETPAEIALSIMAEIVKTRKGGSGCSLSEKKKS